MSLENPERNVPAESAGFAADKAPALERNLLERAKGRAKLAADVMILITALAAGRGMAGQAGSQEGKPAPAEHGENQEM